MNTPTAFETELGWVLTGKTSAHSANHLSIAYHYIAVASGDDLIRKLKRIPKTSRISLLKNALSSNTSRRRILNRKQADLLYRYQRILSVSRSDSPDHKQLENFSHSNDLSTQRPILRVLRCRRRLFHPRPCRAHTSRRCIRKPAKDTFYPPMHAVRKEQSTTTKVRVVFDASANSASGVSLNDTLLVGPTIHPPLVNVLLRFRLQRVALTADIRKMYRAVELAHSDRDLHRFVWRKNVKEP